MAQCEVCGTEVVQGRGRARRTCSAACRQKAHRQRQAQQLTELRAAAAARPALALVPPPAPVAVETSAPDAAGPAGRIRAAGAALAASIEAAAQRAADGWTPRPGADSTAETWAGAVRVEAAEVVAAILASAAAPSRDEPAAPAPVPAPAPAVPGVPTADPESSRDEPAARQLARRKRLTQKAARAIADRSHLVRDERHEGWLLRDDETGTVLGHVEPSYGGTSVSGRNGWTYRVDGSFARTGPYKTRDKAAVPCALAWMRLVTAPAR
jgi:hypothetical protein